MAALKVPVTLKDHIQGDPEAPVVLVEYGDYECPHCGRAYPIVKKVQKHFGKKLCFAFRNFPLAEAHPHAESAAETAEFAGDHDKYWDMHDLLFEDQDRLGGPLYVQLAESLDLDPRALLQAIEGHEFLPKIRADFSSGARSGVNGTPAFFINGQRHDGPWDYADLVYAIDGELSRLAKAAGA